MTLPEVVAQNAVAEDFWVFETSFIAKQICLQINSQDAGDFY
jgi:hypothetical protein